MGYTARGNSASRHIKVELRSTSAITFILSHAKYLRDSNYHYRVNICKWLKPEELHDLKALRQHCHDLNKTYSLEHSKRKLFVVISEKIMRQNVSGKLEVYNETSSSAPCKSFKLADISLKSSDRTLDGTAAKTIASLAKKSIFGSQLAAYTSQESQLQRQVPSSIKSHPK